MKRYFFILGRNQALSLAEIAAVFKKQGIDFGRHFSGGGFFVFENGKELDLADMNRLLGGVIKAGEILFEIESGGRLADEIKNVLSKETILESFLNNGDKKNFLGFSLYHENEREFPSLKKEIEKHLLAGKKALKEAGKKIRFVTSREKRLSSVVVKKNKLLTQGSEIIILITEKKIFLGRTKSVQDFGGYNFRDFRRPYRDMEIGLLPPKLAKILINLSRTEKEEIILDPFCGSGTILQEAILLGYKKVFGSDINLAALNSTKKNLDWLYEKYLINPEEQRVKIFSADVRQIQEHLESSYVKTVVTEPYLGPPIRLNLKESRAKRIIENVSNLYLDFFQAIKPVMLPHGRIVIIWPVFRVNGKLYPLPILERVLASGFRQERLIPEELSSYHLPEATKRGTIIYSRPDQKVLREIFVFSNV